jgi:HPt (histidine-containing phosphotransfer) domain-containing protein
VDNFGQEAANAPIDLAHLARQTMDDVDLQREVLAIFVRQAEIARNDLPAAVGEDRKKLAHKLTGAAHAVGAFALADRAARLMEEPCDTDALASIGPLVDEVARFVAQFNTGQDRTMSRR